MAKRILSKPIFNDNGYIVGFTCLSCHESKPLDGFYKDKKGKYGYTSKCKTCRLEYVNERYKIPENRLRVIMNVARRRCKKQKSYIRKGIKFFLTFEDMLFLWKRDGGHMMKVPSIDRIDNDGHYTLKNCRFIEHTENSKRNGLATPIIQMDSEFNEIERYVSLGEAVRVMGFKNDHFLKRCLSGKIEFVGGFRWEYQEGVKRRTRD